MKRKKHYRVAKKQQEVNQACCGVSKKFCAAAFLFVICAFLDGLIVGALLTKLSRR